MRAVLVLLIVACLPGRLVAADLSVTSPDFDDGTPIPAKFSRDGDNVNPPLEVSGVPPGAKSLAIEMIDPDAGEDDWVHWLVANIPPTANQIAAGELPAGCVVGANGWNAARYDGPQPPSGTHRYVIRLYALNVAVDLKPGFTRTELEDAMAGHVLAEAGLSGTFAH